MSIGLWCLVIVDFKRSVGFFFPILSLCYTCPTGRNVYCLKAWGMLKSTFFDTCYSLWFLCFWALSGWHPTSITKTISNPSSNKEVFLLFVSSPVPSFYNPHTRLYVVVTMFWRNSQTTYMQILQRVKEKGTESCEDFSSLFGFSA